MTRGLLALSIIIAVGMLHSAVPADASDTDQHRLLERKSIGDRIPPLSRGAVVETKMLKPLREEKMAGPIRSLVQSWDNHVTDGRARGLFTAELRESFQPKNIFIQMRQDGTVQVHVTLKNVDDTSLSALEQFNLDIEVLSTKLNKIQGWIDIVQLDALSESPDVLRISAPKYGHTRSGSTTSEGSAILKSDHLRELGFAGEGIRVGIISDGANDWNAAQASGDLPEDGITIYGSCTKREANPVACVSRRTCNEGTAMAEIIHDLAPGAEIAVGAVGTDLEFIQRVDDLVNIFGADIVVDDIGFYGEPYFEDGDVAAAVAAATSTVLFVSSAGNSGNGHYEQDYAQSTSYTWHDFGLADGGPGDIDQEILIPPESYIVVIMQWNDPFSSPENDYDLYLFDDIPELIVASTEDQSLSGSSPIEGFCYYNPAAEEQVRYLLVDKYSGSPRRLEVFTLGAWDTWYNHPEGSIIGHPSVNEVIAVGAVNADDPGNDDIAYYSSRGPARIDFPALEVRSKPDLIGIDGVSVTGAGSFSNPFFGTSAAAPHVAAIAAQLLSVSPTVTIDHVHAALIDGALDLGPSGFDDAFGYGIVDALQSYNMLDGITPGDVNGDGIVDLIDAILTLQSMSNSGSGTIVRRADVDGDGRIGLTEALYILDDVVN